MKSYFFIPASRLRKLTEVNRSAPDAIIIDFEDAILSTKIESYFLELQTIPEIATYWFRLPLRNDFNASLNLEYIEKFNAIGVKYIVLPKLKSFDELIEITETFKNIKFIVLIEHPRLLLEMRNALMHHPKILYSLVGIGLGSHDLMTYLSAKHTSELLDYPRKEVLYLAKSYDLLAIDIASMNIFNKDEFITETIYGQENGYDAKFIIHPNQLNWMQNQAQQSTETLNWARNVLKHLPKNYRGEGIIPFVLDGEVIEKPHALKALEIIKKYNNGE